VILLHRPGEPHHRGRSTPELRRAPAFDRLGSPHGSGRWVLPSWRPDATMRSTDRGGPPRGLQHPGDGHWRSSGAQPQADTRLLRRWWVGSPVAPLRFCHDRPLRAGRVGRPAWSIRWWPSSRCCGPAAAGLVGTLGANARARSTGLCIYEIGTVFPGRSVVDDPMATDTVLVGAAPTWAPPRRAAAPRQLSCWACVGLAGPAPPTRSTQRRVVGVAPHPFGDRRRRQVVVGRWARLIRRCSPLRK
jgi:hypothetical protein